MFPRDEITLQKCTLFCLDLDNELSNADQEEYIDNWTVPYIISHMQTCYNKSKATQLTNALIFNTEPWL